MNGRDYWVECVSEAAEECDLLLTREQLAYLAKAVEGAHENYGMAFYSPPASDQIAATKREWKLKFDRLREEFDAYRNNAESAVRIALRQYPDVPITIGEDGEVLRGGGRTERIQ